MRKFLFELVLLALAVGLTVEIIKPLIPYLPLIWLLVLCHYTWEAISSEPIAIRARAIKERLHGGQLMLSYVAVALAGAVLLSFYWWGLNAVLEPKIKAYEAERTAKVGGSLTAENSAIASRTAPTNGLLPQATPESAAATAKTAPTPSHVPTERKKILPSVEAVVARARTFTEAEMTVLTDGLKNGRGGGINIVTVGDSTDAKAVSAQLRKIFNDAQWNVSLSAIGSMNITVAGIGRVKFEGIYLVPGNADQKLTDIVASAFDAARPHTLATSQYLTSRGGLELYVVYGNE